LLNFFVFVILFTVVVGRFPAVGLPIRLLLWRLVSAKSEILIRRRPQSTAKKLNMGLDYSESVTKKEPNFPFSGCHFAFDLGNLVMCILGVTDQVKDRFTATF